MALSAIAALDAALPEILASGNRKPIRVSRPLRALFRDLAQDRPSRNPDDIEDLIWAHWIDHPEPDASQAMAEAIDAITTRSFDVAEHLLNRLVSDRPDWAEAWNKRATLRFIERRDADSIGDIVEVLRIEPRHFGALSGFGQICLRLGRPVEAKAAFMLALAVNPHLQGLRETIAQIDAATPRRQ